MNLARRLIASLLAVYMLTLVLMPCNDDCESNDHLITLTFQAPQAHHDLDKDVCSPFCSCACCALLITLTQPTELSTFTPAVVKNYPSLKQSYLPAYADDCWQPPRFV